MALIQLVLSAIILGILYRKMLQRAKPTPVSGAQAIVPIFLGVLSLMLSFLFFLGIAFGFQAAGFSLGSFSPAVHSFLGAFFTAGLPEEVAKCLMILLMILLFRRKIRSVYEVILIGAGVGFGFTLLEEFLYGGGAQIMILFRLFTLAAHMIFGILMGKHLGLAMYNKATGKGSVAGEALKGFLIPLLIHTLFDSGVSSNNHLVDSPDDNLAAIGMIFAFAVLIGLFVMQFVVLRSLKKKSEEYCEKTLA